jgi:hypothetical protein
MTAERKYQLVFLLPSFFVPKISGSLGRSNQRIEGAKDEIYQKYQ